MSQKVFNLLRTRDFGDLLQDSIQFVIANIRIIVTGLLVFVGGLYLISAILETMYFRDVLGFGDLDLQEVMDNPEAIVEMMMASMQNGPNWTIVLLSSLVSTASFIVFMLVINGIMILYKNNPGGAITLEGIREKVFTYFLPYLGLTLLNTLVFLAFYFGGILLVILGSMVHGALSGILAIGLVGVIFYVMVVLSLTYIIRMNENDTNPQAIRRAFQLIKGHWWQTFGLYVVVFLVMILLYAGLGIMSFLLVSIFGADIVSIGALAAVGTLVGYVLGATFNSILLTAVGLQYFNLQEERSGSFDESRIDEIGEEYEDHEDSF